MISHIFEIIKGIRGSFGYLAPEKFLEFDESVPHTKATDIYSFGILMFELFFGYLPFNTNNRLVIAMIKTGSRDENIDPIRKKLKELDDECCLRLKRLIENCCSYSPETRPRIESVVRTLELIVSTNQKLDQT